MAKRKPPTNATTDPSPGPKPAPPARTAAEMSPYELMKAFTDAARALGPDSRVCALYHREIMRRLTEHTADPLRQSLPRIETGELTIGRVTCNKGPDIITAEITTGTERVTAEVSLEEFALIITGRGGVAAMVRRKARHAPPITTRGEPTA